MTSDWTEGEDPIDATRDDEEHEDDPGFLGGGGVAETAEGGGDELDEHGERLSRVDEDEL